MTLRNRELLNLVAVGLLTTAGFAAVYLASQEVPEFSTTSLSYAGFFLALFVAAHLVVRLALPDADPYLLPIAGLLTAIGLTMIYRIEPGQAFRQGGWVVVGVALFAAVALFVGEHRRLDALIRAANENGGEDNVTVVLFEMLASDADAEETVPEAEPPADADPDTMEFRAREREAAEAQQDEAGDQSEAEAEAPASSPRRFGAGPGGRIAAILLILVLLGLGALVLYLFLNR